jgi:hypothetical protein
LQTILSEKVDTRGVTKENIISSPALWKYYRSTSFAAFCLQFQTWQKENRKCAVLEVFLQMVICISMSTSFSFSLKAILCIFIYLLISVWPAPSTQVLARYHQITQYTSPAIKKAGWFWLCEKRIAETVFGFVDKWYIFEFCETFIFCYHFLQYESQNQKYFIHLNVNLFDHNFLFLTVWCLNLQMMVVLRME